APTAQALAARAFLGGQRAKLYRAALLSPAGAIGPLDPVTREADLRAVQLLSQLSRLFQFRRQLLINPERDPGVEGRVIKLGAAERPAPPITLLIRLVHRHSEKMLRDRGQAEGTQP